METVKCVRCGKKLDFWKHYRTQLCDECNKELDEKCKRIKVHIEKKNDKE